MRIIACALAAVVIPIAALAAPREVKMEPLTYQVGDVVMKGYIAYPADLKGQRPGVLVVHEWMGLNAYAKRRAQQLAALGYVALAADIYGNGKTAKDVKEAGSLSGALKQDRPEMRKRAAAALAALKGFQHTDTNRIAAIGYCFGGTVVLELARSGAALNGVVTFHGGLDTPTPEDARNIRAALLVCHGANDPYVPRKDVEAFQDEMNAAGVDWQMILYSGAVHSFTNPDSGNDPSKGVAYNAKADRRSWEHMKLFFHELFGPVEP